MLPTVARYVNRKTKDRTSEAMKVLGAMVMLRRATWLLTDIRGCIKCDEGQPLEARRAVDGAGQPSDAASGPPSESSTRGAETGRAG